MVTSLIKALFHKINSAQYERPRKRNHKECMICLTPTPNKKKKKSRKTGIFSWTPLSPDLKPLDYTIWSVLEKKTKATSHPNIGSLKSAIEEERNKMPEEFILKASKSFQRLVDAIIEKKWQPYLLFSIYLLIQLFIFKIRINFVFIIESFTIILEYS